MKRKLGTARLPITSGKFLNAFPDLEHEFGENTEFDIDFEILHPRVKFSPQDGSNIRFSFDVEYGLKELGSMNYIIYDRVHFKTLFNMEIS